MDVVMNVSLKFYSLNVNFGMGNRSVDKTMSFLGLEIMAHLL